MPDAGAPQNLLGAGSDGHTDHLPTALLFLGRAFAVPWFLGALSGREHVLDRGLYVRLQLLQWPERGVRLRVVVRLSVLVFARGERIVSSLRLVAVRAPARGLDDEVRGEAAAGGGDPVLDRAQRPIGAGLIGWRPSA